MLVSRQYTAGHESDYCADAQGAKIIRTLSPNYTESIGIFAGNVELPRAVLVTLPP